MTNNKIIYKILLVGALVCLLTFVIIQITGASIGTGPFLTLFFVLLALSFNGFESLKRFSYTVWIFAAVTISMYFPQLFIKSGDFEFKRLIVPLLQIIMFGMGSQMSVKDFAGVIKMPKGVIIGVVAQYSIMPIVGFAIAMLFNFPTEIAAGILLIGCAPSGLASNVMSYIAKANLALAVTLAAVATLISPLMTPLLMKTLAGQYIEIKFWSMMLGIINMMILPIIAGFIFNLFSKSSQSSKNRMIQLLSFLLIILIKNFIYLKSYEAPSPESSETALHAASISFLWDMFWFYFLPMIVATLLKMIFREFAAWMDKVLSFVSMAEKILQV